ncbi:glycosyltransferase, partial [bacterium]
LLAADARSLVEDVRRRGVWELRRRFSEAMSPSIWSERKEIGHGLNQIMRAISVTNRDFLARLPAATAEPAFSLSFVVPIFRTPRAWLEQLVASMKNQTDHDFEAVFVFDGPQPELEAALADGLDGTFAHRVLVLPENRGVSAASNAGIRESTGEFLMVVDHDDVLERHLVEAFHRASAAEPADIYYADEAITDAQMQLVRSVASRGQFDIRHYLSHPYIVHPIMVRRTVAEGAGLFDETLRVSHDVDFFLRCVARARCVVQIPLVLYFWRTHASSLGHAAMDAVYDNTSASVRAYLAGLPGGAGFEVRRGINFNELDIRPPVPEGLRVAIVIPTKNGLGVLQQCLASIQTRAASNRVPADVIVVDHESDDPQTLAYLASEREAGRIQVARHVGPWNYS